MLARAYVVRKQIVSHRPRKLDGCDSHIDHDLHVPSIFIARSTILCTASRTIFSSSSFRKRSNAWKLPIVQLDSSREGANGTEKRGLTIADVSYNGRYKSEFPSVFLRLRDEIREPRDGDTVKRYIHQQCGSCGGRRLTTHPYSIP